MKIGLTASAFDLLHAGHILMLKFERPTYHFWCDSKLLQGTPKGYSFFKKTTT